MGPTRMTRSRRQQKPLDGARNGVDLGSGEVRQTASPQTASHPALGSGLEKDAPSFPAPDQIQPDTKSTATAKKPNPDNNTVEIVATLTSPQATIHSQLDITSGNTFAPNPDARKSAELHPSPPKRKIDTFLGTEDTTSKSPKRVRLSTTAEHGETGSSPPEPALVSKIPPTLDDADAEFSIPGKPKDLKANEQPSGPTQSPRSPSSVLSEPPTVLGPTPPGLLSPQHQLDDATPQHQLDDATPQHEIGNGSPVRRSARVRKANPRRVGATDANTSRKTAKAQPLLTTVTEPSTIDKILRSGKGPSGDHDSKTSRKRVVDGMVSGMPTPSPDDGSPAQKKRKLVAEPVSMVKAMAPPQGKKTMLTRASARLRSINPVNSAVVDSVETSSQQTNTDTYASDPGTKKSTRGGGRGGRGNYGRGRGGRGRGGAASGRGRGDSPERPSKHILTLEEKIEVARLKKRQAELRHFFNFVGNQQADILDVLAGRDIAILTRKAKAHEKFSDHAEVLEDLAYYRDQKIDQVRKQYQLEQELANTNLRNEKELIEQQFKIRISRAREEHIAGAAGDLAIFKKSIAAGGDDAHTVAGSELDYLPRYHELPEADAQVRGYNSSKIEDEKPFRRDLPSFDEVAARDVMEDEITRPVIEALHRKRAEEQAAIAHEEQERAEEEAREQTQTIAALAEFAASDHGQREIANVEDYLNPRSMRAPQYGSFGLSTLADAAEAFAKPFPAQQYNTLPPPLDGRSSSRQASGFDQQVDHTLHFPPPPPKLYIPQQHQQQHQQYQHHPHHPQHPQHPQHPHQPPPPPPPPPPPQPITSSSQDPTFQSPTHGIHRVLSPTTGRPFTPIQPYPTPAHYAPTNINNTNASSNINSTTSSRRSLRSIAPQPLPRPPSMISTGPANSIPQTYTFVPPQQPPHSTHFAPTVPAPTRTSSSSASSTPIATSAPPLTGRGSIGMPMPGANGAHHHHMNTILNNSHGNNINGTGHSGGGSGGTTPTQQHQHQPILPKAISGMAHPRANIAPTPLTDERRSSGPKQGQGKISMQFFNSIIDGNGKRALLPKP